MGSSGKTERLHKIMARAGIASLRKSENLIREGRVQVDGQVVTEMGFRVDPAASKISVDGVEIGQDPRKVYIMLHKPRGYLSTTEDPHGRPVIVDLLSSSARLFPVGRLDVDSEGLVLLTNDGDLTNRLVHPRYGHWRRYLVLVHGRPSARDLDRLRQGVDLEDGRTAPARVSLVKEETKELFAFLGPLEGQQGLLDLRIREGRKRQVRRMMDAVGLRVVRLVRVGLGTLYLGRLPVGASRPLKARELRLLRREVGLSGRTGAPTGSRST